MASQSSTASAIEALMRPPGGAHRTDVESESPSVLSGDIRSAAARLIEVTPSSHTDPEPSPMMEATDLTLEPGQVRHQPWAEFREIAADTAAAVVARDLTTAKASLLFIFIVSAMLGTAAGWIGNIWLVIPAFGPMVTAGLAFLRLHTR